MKNYKIWQHVIFHWFVLCLIFVWLFKWLLVRFGYLLSQFIYYLFMLTHIRIYVIL